MGVKPNGFSRRECLGDDNLTDTAAAELWEGDGSEEFPYIIESYNITLPGISGRCVEIHNISLYLIIRNCVFINGNVGLHLENVTDFTAERNSFLHNGNGVATFESSHVTLTGNYFYFNSEGVYLNNVQLLYIADNVFESSSNYGVYGTGVTSSTIFNNSVHDADVGIWLHTGCGGNEIRRNSLDDILFTCLQLDINTWSNIVIWNNFGVSLQSVSDPAIGGLNVFSHNYYFEFTYGSDDDNDGIYDEPYAIPGFASFDYNPLKYPPLPPFWEVFLTEQYVEFGDSLVYELSVNSSPPVRSWHINDTLHFLIDDEGTITDRGNLNVGVYSLEVTVTDLYGASVSGLFTVSVSDTVAPVWATTPTDQQFYYGEDIDIQIIAWDLSGIASWTLNDEVNFTLTSTTFGESGVARISSFGTLEPGTYSLHVEAHDSNGLLVAGSFTVTIVNLSSDGASLVWMVAPAGLAVVAIAIALYGMVKPKQST
ncbi:MAG: NosD domain-containing protein [Candidatus Thorarchaeota archaeon]|jgi:hypothetical protein